MRILHTLLGSTLVAAAIASTAYADEGMWLFNDPPRKILKAKYDFNPTGQWLSHLQQSAVRFNVGGSGSFVSSDGLVLTNHHVGSDAIQKLSTPEKNYLRDGFHAKTRAEELKCLDMELNVLQSIEDVTQRVNAAVRPGSSMADAQKARQAVMNTIEQDSLEKTGLRSDVVTLYNGGLYHLYRYKKYTDVRLVFAPEQAAAFFGGDADNFEYPRYDLDICFFRVYEDGKPAKIANFLRWDHAGPGDGELVFVVGHPGKTDRLDTVAHLEFIRDRVLPGALDRARRKEILLQTFSQRSEENARRAQDELFEVQNARKSEIGRLDGLQDPVVMGRKRAEERALRHAAKAVLSGRSLEEKGRIWEEIAAAVQVWRKVYTQNVLLERGAAFQSELFVIARTLLRMAEETRKPNADRLREYRESNLESLRQDLYSEAPIHKDLEAVKLASSLSMYVELAGADDELVRKVLAGKSPQERAAELVEGTRLQEVAFRRKLAEGGVEAIQASRDPMVALARLVDPAAREVRLQDEQQVQEPLRQAYGKLANLRPALLGGEVYPDATFTLRLSFGVVRGYSELDRKIEPWTTLGGAFRRAEEHGNRPPFHLPKRWLQRKSRLDLNTPLNFVATTDIVGGNSGSPVVNRQGEFVGIIFDGNLQSLVWDFVYTEKQGRAVAVHSRAIEETLRKIYDAGALADELGR